MSRTSKIVYFIISIIFFTCFDLVLSDFVIKNISEDSSTKAFTYTCKDLFVNELSKTGFELEFDNELGNNMGNLPTLAEKILEGSDW